MKYFLIKPNHPENFGAVHYTDSAVQAEIYQRYTQDGKPAAALNLRLPLQFEVVFANNEGEKVMLPFYTLNTRNALFRKDFLEAVLAAGDSEIKTLDALIIDSHTGSHYADYQFISMEKIDIFDKTKKNYWEGLVVLKKDDHAASGLHIFYIDDTSILIDEQAKACIEKRGIPNIAYYDPEKYAGLQH